MDDGSTPNSAGFLREIRDTVNRRIKLIKLEDRSEAGWSMVANYTADSLVENSEDELHAAAAVTSCDEYMAVITYEKVKNFC